MVKQIPLTQGKFALVDDEDFDYLSQWKWHITARKYAARSLTLNGKKSSIYMHRVLSKNDKRLHTDHINGDTFDNRKENLRICSAAENIRNAKSKKGSSHYKGVSWSKERNKWHVNITYNRKAHYIGRFEKEIDAAIAYNNAAKKFFGAFARLNKI
jgi:hypothetical protein